MRTAWCRILVVGVLLNGIPAVSAADTQSPITMVVMDPLAAPLSCPCVEGYAQRRYEVLAEHLQQTLQRDVAVVFGESLRTARQKAGGPVHLIVGKHSVVLADGKAARQKLTPLCQLTDREGSTEQHGLIVVNRDDPARKVADLSGYTIIFGPSEAAEKHSAALNLLKAAQVQIPKTLQIDEACSDGACKVIDLGPESRSAAVISSYAQPLLEGCGTIQKGDLRVVGRTKPVPFITAFATEHLPQADQAALQDALLAAVEKSEVLDALESLLGFQPMEAPESASRTQVLPVSKKK